MKISPSYLREKADFAEELGYSNHANLLRDAAETIEDLQARLEIGSKTNRRTPK